MTEIHIISVGISRGKFCEELQILQKLVLRRSAGTNDRRYGASMTCTCKITARRLSTKIQQQNAVWLTD